MKDEKLKLKNIKDLEYNHLLNKQNIISVIIGTAVISIVLSEKIPEGFSKYGLIIALILTELFFLLHYSNKLEEKSQEIKEM